MQKHRLDLLKWINQLNMNRLLLLLIFFTRVDQINSSVINYTVNFKRFLNPEGESNYGVDINGKRKKCDTDTMGYHRLKTGSCDTYFVVCFGGINSKRHCRENPVQSEVIHDRNSIFTNDGISKGGQLTNTDIRKTQLIIDVFDNDGGDGTEVIDIFQVDVQMYPGRSNNRKRTYTYIWTNVTTIKIELQVWCDDEACRLKYAKGFQTKKYEEGIVVSFKNSSSFNITDAEESLQDFLHQYICHGHFVSTQIYQHDELDNNTRIFFSSKCENETVTSLQFHTTLSSVIINRTEQLNFQEITGYGSLPSQNETKALIAIKIIHYNNPNGLSYTYKERPRKPCDDDVDKNNTCDTAFSFCVGRLITYQAGFGCDGAIGSTQEFQDTNYIGTYQGDFNTSSIVGIVNKPIILVSKKWFTNQTIYIEVKDKDVSKTSDLILNMTFYTDLRPSPIQFNISTPRQLVYNGSEGIELQLKIWAWCGPYYYGTECEKFCKPNNEHEICDLESGILKCVEGWSGSNCECKNNYCKHGTCKILNGNETCICDRGWVGDLCDSDINECSNNPCQNNGSCHNGNGNFWCNCINGWSGTLCNIDINECSFFPCLNNGICQNIDGSFVCNCKTGWNGSVCETDINECVKAPCLHSGICHNTDGGFVCTCAKGWHGTHCEVDINECESRPCLHNGLCNNTKGSFECICEKGWKGVLCQTDVDECVDHPCENNGTCLNTNGSYICNCTEGWTGKNCHEDVNECNINPCMNNGTCLNTNGSFICRCNQDWSGNLCGHFVNKTQLYGITTRCSLDNWEVRVNMSKLLLYFPDALTSDIYLGEESCSGVLVGNNLTFKYAYADNNCETKLKINSKSVLFSNELIYAIHDPLFPFITTEYKFRIKMWCIISSTETVAEHFNLQGNKQNYASHINKTKPLHTAHMSFYDDAEYSREMSGNPITKHIGEKLYVKVFTDLTDSSVKIHLKDCYTKPYNTSSDRLRFFLVKNGCPLVYSKAIHISQHQTTFSFQVFEYSNDHKSIYLYCDVKICNITYLYSECNQTCEHRRNPRNAVLDQSQKDTEADNNIFAKDARHGDHHEDLPKNSFSFVLAAFLIIVFITPFILLMLHKRK